MVCSLSSCIQTPDLPLPSIGRAIAANGDSWWQPTAKENLRWYWQLQDKLNASHDVDVYNIDIETPQYIINSLKSRGIKLICYFSVGTMEEFRADAGQFPADIVGETYPGYEDERWLDLSKYPRFAHVMRERLDRCAAKGFDGVEGDNVDAFVQRIPDNNGVIRTGTTFGITRQHSIDYVRWLAHQSHQRGLAFGLKNAESIASEVVSNVDWMLLESCYKDGWCAEAEVFVENNKPVFMTEYAEYLVNFSDACEQAKKYRFNAIYRDAGLTRSGVFKECLLTD